MDIDKILLHFQHVVAWVPSSDGISDIFFSKYSILYCNCRMAANIMPKDISSKILDSAFIIAIVSAICYVLGYMAQIRAAISIGLPGHLLHDPSLHGTITLGGYYLLLIFAISLFLWVFVALVSKLLPRKWVSATKDYLKNRYLKHPVFYKLLAVLILTTLFCMLSLYAPIEARSYREDVMPYVKELKLHDNLKIQGKNLRFVCRKDGFIVLKRCNQQDYIILNSDDVKLLILKPAD